LLLHSVVALREEEMKKLDALGEVALIVAPGPGHRLDLTRYRARYPKAKLLAPAASRKKIEEVCPVDDTCESALAGLVEIHAIPGMRTELVYEVAVDGGRALIVNDLLGNGVAPAGLAGWIFSKLGTKGGELGIPRIVRFIQVKDQRAARGFIAQQSARDDLAAVTVSHGLHVTDGVGSRLKAASVL
jgi:hypothetical protein